MKAVLNAFASLVPGSQPDIPKYNFHSLAPSPCPQQPLSRPRVRVYSGKSS
jgi:hypothetical protein